MHQWKFITLAIKVSVAAFILSMAPSIAEAACHAVSASGSGSKSGADWNDTMANLPASLVRGDTYYLADGSGYVFQSADGPSGTIVTTVRKAMANGDFGQSCSPSIAAGWNGATMGSAQAVFIGAPAIDLRGLSYVTIDGQSRTSLSSGHGILLDSSACVNASCTTLNLGSSGSAKASNIIEQYVEHKQSNPTGNINFDDDAGVFAYANDQDSHASTLHDILLQYNYYHNSACDFIKTRNVTNFTIQYSYLLTNSGGSACHGQAWEDNNSVNITASYNLWSDIRGTATLVILSDGFNETTTGWFVYGNVFYDYPGGSGWNANGTIACINSGITCQNMFVYNNTFANQQNTGAGAGANIVGVTVNAASASPVCMNNLFYNVNSNVSFEMDCPTEDYNSVIASGNQSRVFTGAHDVQRTANTNLFTNPNATPPAAADFTLTSEGTPAYTGGVLLAFPYSQACGQILCTSLIPRGADGSWERGAYEFSSSNGVQLPNPPQNVQILSIQ